MYVFSWKIRQDNYGSFYLLTQVLQGNRTSKAHFKDMELLNLLELCIRLPEGNPKIFDKLLYSELGCLLCLNKAIPN